MLTKHPAEEGCPSRISHAGQRVSQCLRSEVRSHHCELVYSGPLSTFLCTASMLPLRYNCVEYHVHSLSRASFRSEVGREEPGPKLDQGPQCLTGEDQVFVLPAMGCLSSSPETLRPPCTAALLIRTSPCCCGLKNQSQAELTCCWPARPL